jgi:hypothetical protein
MRIGMLSSEYAQASLFAGGPVTICVDQVPEALQGLPASTTVAARAGRLFA